jgi:hypothetical protein
MSSPDSSTAAPKPGAMASSPSGIHIQGKYFHSTIREQLAVLESSRNSNSIFVIGDHTRSATGAATLVDKMLSTKLTLRNANQASRTGRMAISERDSCQRRVSTSSDAFAESWPLTISTCSTRKTHCWRKPRVTRTLIMTQASHSWHSRTSRSNSHASPKVLSAVLPRSRLPL